MMKSTLVISSRALGTNNMRSFEHAYNVLLKVVEEGIPFNLAIKSSLKQEKKNIDSSFKMDISASSGCVLRHYYVFKELFLRKYPEEKENKFLLFALGLANHLFSKRFDEKELEKYIAKESELEGVLEYINSFNDPKALIPSDIEYRSKKYISLRYNIPIWIVNMWQKNAGQFLSYKLFKSFGNYKNHLVRINENQIDIAEFYKKYTDFAAFEDDSSVAIYGGKDNVTRHQAIRNEDAYLIPGGYKYMLQDLDLDSIRGIAIYGGMTNHLLGELSLRLGVNFKADYLCGTQKHFFETKDVVKKYGFTDLSIYECEHQAILTCISKPVHTFFLSPENSYFLGLLERPDYFLSCKQENLDEFIKIEYESLIEASAQVEEGGDLVYFVPTFCRNECRGLIRRFLKENAHFRLVNEKQLFPFDKYQTMLYFAILRKENKND